MCFVNYWLKWLLLKYNRTEIHLTDLRKKWKHLCLTTWPDSPWMLLKFQLCRGCKWMKLAEGVGPRKHDVQAVIISSQDSVGRAMDILAQEMDGLHSLTHIHSAAHNNEHWGVEKWWWRNAGLGSWTATFAYVLFEAIFENARKIRNHTPLFFFFIFLTNEVLKLCDPNPGDFWKR